MKIPHHFRDLLFWLAFIAALANSALLVIPQEHLTARTIVTLVATACTLLVGGQRLGASVEGREWSQWFAATYGTPAPTAAEVRGEAERIRRESEAPLPTPRSAREESGEDAPTEKIAPPSA